MPLLTPEWSLPPGVQARFSTRAGGVSKPPYTSLNLGDHVGDDPRAVLENRNILKTQLPSEPLWLKQTHGVAVSTPRSRSLFQKVGIEADAAVTNVPNEVLVVMTADCLPVLFSSSNGEVVGVAHAGWRGLCGGVLESTVQEILRLSTDLKPADILVWLGPAIGPQAFEVGEDVVDAFCSDGLAIPPDAFVPIAGREGKYLANLYLLARQRLLALGLKDIRGGTHCTYQEKEHFFSYRRDGLTGRFASFIWISA